MNNRAKDTSSQIGGSKSGLPAPPPVDTVRVDSLASRRSLNWAWWIRLCLQPLLLLAMGILFLAGLGLAQRAGVFVQNRLEHQHASGGTGSDATLYICPMMCTPPRSEPGRCPVCGMELVPTTSGSGHTDPRSVTIDPATRRVANIQTATVVSTPLTRTIRAIGELNYDEGTLKTISAYVDGRLDRLYADYTGVVVSQGDRLALLYSPRLYSSQVELLLAKRSLEQSRATSSGRPVSGSENLYESARQRLLLLGMTESQIRQLVEAGTPSSHLPLSAPIGGTVIERLAVEGQYVKEGDPIYRLADLSTVWLMLRLFPEDAVLIRYGQRVEAEVQSLPERTFTGRVAFVDPTVDSKTRTVGVRVVVPNPDGMLRVGDYARATIDVALSNSRDVVTYDPELADKWISPRHPHVVSDSPGDCPICGIELISAAELGFTNNPDSQTAVLVVPRDAVLMAGNNSVVYVETEPGRFEIRRVVTGAKVGDRIVIRSGLMEGEQVATRGNFLIDSQMQLAGNPSVIDPARLALPTVGPAMAAVQAGLADLSEEDRQLAERQGFCPVAELRLGLMGTPKKVRVGDRDVFICCETCRSKLLAEPDKYLAKLSEEAP